MGGNNFEGGSKRTVQVRVENERPVPNNQIAGGRVVGGSFGGEYILVYINRLEAVKRIYQRVPLIHPIKTE
ncbi:hypothetical protein DPMN_188612 [Dreissena polymorpha]|uniref:Uncharacterized protein n=1 Tax=Dreissena polymorpha TaxID=45954 RepID=A0A9D4IBH7_DREPO|nr:hypothetical protein DPMN_188612 [Dreissena polymorpha]